MTTIRLCGRLHARVGGREVTLPGRQGRTVFAYLVVNRGRTVARDELRELLWPAAAPAEPGETLSALLSRMRGALGAGVLGGDLGLALGEHPWIDLEAAQAGVEQAEAALAAGDPAAAWERATAAREIAGGGFLTGDELPWLDERRRELEQLRLRALEAMAAAGAGLGAPERSAAERAARALVEAAPFRESGHRLLMGALDGLGERYTTARLLADLVALAGGAGGLAEEVAARLEAIGALASAAEARGAPRAV